MTSVVPPIPLPMANVLRHHRSSLSVWCMLEEAAVLVPGKSVEIRRMWSRNNHCACRKNLASFSRTRHKGVVSAKNGMTILPALVLMWVWCARSDLLYARVLLFLMQEVVDVVVYSSKRAFSKSSSHKKNLHCFDSGAGQRYSPFP